MIPFDWITFWRTLVCWIIPGLIVLCVVFIVALLRER